MNVLFHHLKHCLASKPIFILAFPVFLSAYLPAQSWLQLGQPVYGNTIGDNAGFAITLDNNGNRLAVSSPGNDDNGTNSGLVRVFQWDGSSWKQLGQSLNGEFAGDGFGFSVSLSSDGTRLAASSILSKINADNAGQVRVFQWDMTQWIPMGDDINGGNPDDLLGTSVSLSSDGTRLAVGANQNTVGNIQPGFVKVFDWNGSDWVQAGSDIIGSAGQDKFGSSVSLSANGNRLAIGANRNDEGGKDAGQVRIYDWNGNDWIQAGNKINGELIYAGAGRSVSLSSDGTRLAVGADQYDGKNGEYNGQARVYTWDGSDWKPIGTEIVGDISADLLGWSVSLSPDGNWLVVGIPGFGTMDIGAARIFNWDGNEWVKVGEDIYGEAFTDHLGRSVSISADGSRIAVGAVDNDGNGTNSGQVRVYSRVPSGLINMATEPVFELFQNAPNPWMNSTCIGFFLAESSPVSLNIYDALGRIIYRTTADFNSGYHFFKLDDTDLQVSTEFLFYKVETPNFFGVKQMIRRK